MGQLPTLPYPKLDRSRALPGSIHLVVDGQEFIIPSLDHPENAGMVSRISVPEPPSDGLFTMLDVSALVQHGSETVRMDWLRNQIKSLADHNDVFQNSFLRGILFYGVSAGHLLIDDDIRAYLQSQGNLWIRCLPPASKGFKISSGPFALISGVIRVIWKLAEDTNGCFMSTLEPGTMKILKAPQGITGCSRIAISSFQHGQADQEKPLSGWRVAVKDNIHLQGMKTSCGNRAFYDLYPPQPKTAQCIRVLQELGAIIVGKTRLSAFGHWEEPTESIDYQAPWNPRGDGYISPGGSSSGSAAAVASYEWLDVAIGSDTGGSVTRPALWNGCFGIRPSHGLISTDGLVESIHTWDTPGALCRDLKKLRYFADAWYGSKMYRPSFSRILWCTDYWAGLDRDQVALAQDFMRDLESTLGLQHIKMSFTDEWARFTPVDVHTGNLAEYMKHACSDIWYEDYHSHQQFRDDYQTLFKRFPYVNPPVREDWELCSKMTKEEYISAVERLAIFRRWFCDSILDPEGMSTLLVLPIENMYPRYRDEPPTFSRGEDLGVGPNILAAVLGAPELTVPVGEISYYSKVSRRSERLPFALALIGPPGSDISVLDVVLKTLEDAGRPTCMSTGSSAFAADDQG